jgi:hypothetical protein
MPQANAFKALRRKRPGIDRVVGLTGTPSTNGLMDLWSEIYLLDQGKRLGKTLSTYRADFFVPDRMNGWIVYSYRPRPHAEEWIFSRLSDLCVSMKSQDFLQMPERLERDVTVKLPPVAKEKYKELEWEMVAKLEGKTVDAVNAAVLTNKLLQMASGAVYDENKAVAELHAAKLDALEDLIEAANGKPVLIYYNYRHDKERIQKRFKEDSGNQNTGGLSGLEPRRNSGGDSPSRFNGAWLKPPARRLDRDLVFSTLVFRALPTGECQTLAAGTKGHGGHLPSDRRGHD